MPTCSGEGFACVHVRTSGGIPLLVLEPAPLNASESQVLVGVMPRVAQLLRHVGIADVPVLSADEAFETQTVRRALRATGIENIDRANDGRPGETSV